MQVATLARSQAATHRHHWTRPRGSRAMAHRRALIHAIGQESTGVDTCVLRVKAEPARRLHKLLRLCSHHHRASISIPRLGGCLEAKKFL